MRLSVKAAIVGFALLVITLNLVNAEPFTSPNALEILMYTDGVADVSLSYVTDPSQAKAVIQLIGYQYETVLVQDQSGLTLDYFINGTAAKVDTFGSSQLNVSYTTQSLTSKSGTVWTLNFTSPITTLITLPHASTIVSLSSLPIEIKTVQDSPQVLMLPGETSISYINDVFEPRSTALDTLSASINYVNSIKEEGVKAPEADSLLVEAQKAFENGDYSETIRLSVQAERSVDTAKNDFLLSSTSIDDASNSIENAKTEERTTGLDEAETLLHQAVDYHENGEYNSAYSKALEAKIVAEKATKPPSNLPLYLGVLVLVVIIVTMFYIRSKKEPNVKSGKPMNQANNVDLDLIFQKHRNLRMDDKEVIRYIVESGGELFANEIRERFDLPRTSAWRLIRRLKGFGILEERKVGGQSLVSISRRYRN